MNWIIIILVIFGCFNLAFFITWLRRLIKRQFRKKEWTDYLDSLEHVNINPTKPNIIIILTDDMGYQDISCFGAKTVHSLHIDALAGEKSSHTIFHELGHHITHTILSLGKEEYAKNEVLAELSAYLLMIRFDENIDYNFKYSNVWINRITERLN